MIRVYTRIFLNSYNFLKHDLTYKRGGMTRAQVLFVACIFHTRVCEKSKQIYTTPHLVAIVVVANLLEREKTAPVVNRWFNDHTPPWWYDCSSLGPVRSGVFAIVFHATPRAREKSKSFYTVFPLHNSGAYIYTHRLLLYFTNLHRGEGLIE